MNTHMHAQRSTEAPMDFQFTSRPSSNTKPVWANNDSNVPRKRQRFDDLEPTSPPSQALIFGGNPNVPFTFQAPALQTPLVHPWVPRVNFPRVFRSTRQEARMKSRHVIPSRESGNEAEIDGNVDHVPMTRTTSNYYTFNMPANPAPRADMPQVLLGYLQFFFYLFLVMVVLYLLVHFILTVQHDVESGISEYSMGIVQEIGVCATQYRDNLCGNNPVPAMIQQCAYWKTCIDRDPSMVGRARVGARLIADVINGFVEPISWKTLAFILIPLTFLTVTLYRSRHEAVPAAPIVHHYLPSGPAPQGS